jgi:hypothetical protein
MQEVRSAGNLYNRRGAFPKYFFINELTCGWDIEGDLAFSFLSHANPQPSFAVWTSSVDYVLAS